MGVHQFIGWVGGVGGGFLPARIHLTNLPPTHPPTQRVNEVSRLRG